MLFASFPALPKLSFTSHHAVGMARCGSGCWLFADSKKNGMFKKSVGSKSIQRQQGASENIQSTWFLTEVGCLTASVFLILCMAAK
jgi:hypothetical protein